MPFSLWLEPLDGELDTQLDTVFRSEDAGTNDDAKRHLQRLFPTSDPFATPKPEALLERIIHIATNPGDLVLDFFAGSGTTAATSHKMGRQWIVVEWSRETVETFTRPRLEAVVDGSDVGGVSESLEWTGGGGFRVLDLELPRNAGVDETQLGLSFDKHSGGVSR